MQDPDIEGFQAFAGKRRFGTWIDWFLPKNGGSWEEALRARYVKEECLRGGCAKCKCTKPRRYKDTLSSPSSLGPLSSIVKI